MGNCTILCGMGDLSIMKGMGVNMNKVKITYYNYEDNRSTITRELEDINEFKLAGEFIYFTDGEERTKFAIRAELVVTIERVC